MGFMDKLKNIFFEEEEEEEVVETSLKQEKEPIARKVEIPKIKKEEVKIESKEEINDIKEVKKEEFSYVEIKKTPMKQSDLIFDDEDFILETPKPKKEKEVELYTKRVETNIYKTGEPKDLYKKEEIKEKKETPKYEYSYRKEKVEIEKTFIPSPIISPIYGILDKNYKKEEIKEKKEIRISSRPSKMDLDSVRNKAFGDLENDLFDNTPTKEDLEEKEREKRKKDEENREFKKIYDMSDNSKPSIEKVTLAEADEYFNDLGLAYNTDYKDISKEINDGRYPYEKKGDKLEDNLFDLIESMYDKED